MLCFNYYIEVIIFNCNIEPKFYIKSIVNTNNVSTASVVNLESK